MRITIDDVRAIHCARGARRWFEQHGLDFRAFLRDGIDVETFLATGDQRAESVVQHKLLREADVSGVTITARDANRLFCAIGTRAWCRERGVDERAFFGEGVPASDLLALNDPKVNQVVMAKLREEPPYGR